MALKDLVPNAGRLRTAYPAARLRKKLVQLRAAIAQMFAPNATLMMPVQRNVPVATVLAELDAVIAQFDALDDLILQAKTLRRTLTKLLPICVEVIAQLTVILPHTVGYDRTVAIQHGLAPRKKRSKATGAEQVIAAAKRVITRKLRNTMGKRQKAKLKYAGEPLNIVLKPKGNAP